MKTYVGKIKDGDDKCIQVVKEYFRENQNRKDSKYIMTIKRFYHPRSLQQLNFWMGVVCKILSEHTGMTIEEVHDELGMMFFYKYYTGFDGKLKKRRLSMSDMGPLTTKDFMEILEKVQIWAATYWEESPVIIPDPVNLGDNNYE